MMDTDLDKPMESQLPVCSFCKKTFPDGAALKLHLLYHANNFNCTVCQKTCGSKGNLNLHMTRVHIKKMPYRCEKCNMCFRLKSTLRSHHKKSNHWKDKSGTNITNETCTESFVNSELLVCSLCKKTFPLEVDLKLHLQYHKNCNTCNICQEMLNHKENTSAHTEEEYHHCVKCNMFFVLKSTLRSHNKQYHLDDKSPDGATSCKCSELETVSSGDDDDDPSHSMDTSELQIVNVDPLVKREVFVQEESLCPHWTLKGAVECPLCEKDKDQNVFQVEVKQEIIDLDAV